MRLGSRSHTFRLCKVGALSARCCLPLALSGGDRVTLTAAGRGPSASEEGPAVGARAPTSAPSAPAAASPPSAPVPAASDGGAGGGTGAARLRPPQTPPVGGPAPGAVAPGETFAGPGCGLALTTPLPRLPARARAHTHAHMRTHARAHARACPKPSTPAPTPCPQPHPQTWPLGTLRRTQFLHSVCFSAVFTGSCDSPGHIYVYGKSRILLVYKSVHFHK